MKVSAATPTDNVIVNRIFTFSVSKRYTRERSWNLIYGISNGRVSCENTYARMVSAISHRKIFVSGWRSIAISEDENLTDYETLDGASVRTGIDEILGGNIYSQHSAKMSSACMDISLLRGQDG